MDQASELKSGFTAPQQTDVCQQGHIKLTPPRHGPVPGHWLTVILYLQRDGCVTTDCGACLKKGVAVDWSLLC